MAVREAFIFAQELSRDDRMADSVQQQHLALIMSYVPLTSL